MKLASKLYGSKRRNTIDSKKICKQKTIGSWTGIGIELCKESKCSTSWLPLKFRCLMAFRLLTFNSAYWQFNVGKPFLASIHDVHVITFSVKQLAAVTAATGVSTGRTHTVGDPAAVSKMGAQKSWQLGVWGKKTRNYNLLQLHFIKQLSFFSNRSSRIFKQKKVTLFIGNFIQHVQTNDWDEMTPAQNGKKRSWRGQFSTNSRPIRPRNPSKKDGWTFDEWIRIPSALII